MLKKTMDIVSSQYNDILRTIQALCEMDRGSLYVPGLKKVASFLEEEYKKLGCEIFVDDDKEFGPTLVARKKGKGKTHIMLFAHMDTCGLQALVPPGSFTLRTIMRSLRA